MIKITPPIIPQDNRNRTLSLSISKKPTKHKNRTTRKKLTILLLTVVSTVSFATGFTGSQKAQAWAGDIQTCTLAFDSFNWKDQIRDFSTNTAKNSPDSVSTVLIYRFPGEGNGKFVVDMLPSPYLAAFTQSGPDAVGNYSKSVDESLAPGATQVATEFEVDTIAKTVVNNGNVPNSPAHSKYGTDPPGNISDLECLQTAKGFTQPYIWNGKSIPEAVPTQGGEHCNGALDFGCWIGKAFNGIGNGFNAVGRAIVQGIASIFMPDGTKIKSEFDTLSSFLTNKLGFLTFPITFLNNMFQSFTSTANNWCNETSCIKNFGNFQGHPFSLNLNVGASTFPTLWTYVLTAIRGMTVLGLIFAIRHKYMEVVNK